MVDIDGKSLVQSKQFWLMVLTVIAAVAASPEVLNLVPNSTVLMAAVVAVLSIIIRTMTDAPIDRIV